MNDKDYRLSKLFKVYNGVSETKQNREVFEETIKSGLLLDPSHLLTYFDHVPNGSAVSGGQEGLDKLLTLTKTNPTIFFQEDEITNIPILTKHILLPFTPVGPESPKSFKLVKDGKNIQYIIPYNYFEDYYVYHIYRENGLEIPFGVGDWVLDTFSGILTFYGELPEGVDSTHPPLITCFQYVGGTGYKKPRIGLQGVVLPVVNFPVDKGIFSTPGVDTKIKDVIDLITSKIETDFTAKYGWDGADDNEGIALNYEKLIPVRYSSSRDPVKGYDLSADASVGAVISKKAFRAIETRKIVTSYEDTDMPSIVGGRPAVEIQKVVKSFDDFDFTTSTVFENKKELYKNWINDLPADHYLQLDLKDFKLPMVEDINTYKEDLINFEKFLQVLESQQANVILDLSESRILEDTATPHTFKYFIHPSLEQKVEKVYSYIKGFVLPSNTKVVATKALSKFESLVFLDFPKEIQTIEVEAFSGKFETFYIPKSSISDEGIFAKASLKDIYLSSKEIITFFGSTSTPTLGVVQGLKNIFIYDSAFNRYLNSSWKDLAQKDCLHKLSTNPNFPLKSGKQEVDVVPSEWKGKIEYVNNSASLNQKKGYLFYKNKKAWIEVDGVKEREVDVKLLENSKTVVQGYNITLVADFTEVEDCRVEFDLVETDPYVAFFYWSLKQQKHIPFTTNKDSVYDFGFPVVTQIGKIPPSLEFLNNDVLSFGKDELTPDYYGPRLFQKILSTSETPQHLSNDFVVQNKELYFLDQYLKQLFNENPTFEGTIFLRQGNYWLKNTDLFILPAFKNLRFIGEDKKLVRIHCKCFDASNILSTLVLKNIDFGEENTFRITTSNLKVCTVSNIFCKTLQIAKDKSTQLFVGDLSTNEFILEGLTPCDTEELNTAGTFSSRIINIQTLKTKIACDNTYIAGLSTQEFISQSGKTLVSGSQITKVLSKPTGTQIVGSDVRYFDPSISVREVPSEAHFKMWEKLANNQVYQRYTRFTDPFEWDSEKGLIKIKLDPEVLHIDSKGRLSTNLKASDIAINPDDYTRDETAVDSDTGKKTPVTATTLKEALQDLFLKKADLIKGKISLRQLPDSVAYGGLHYCGVWSFDDHGGKYPTFSDLSIDLSVEDHIQDLQPGWFFIINPPKSELEKNKNDDTYSPAKEQRAEDGVVYTAGDWMVYTGKIKVLVGGVETLKTKFEKIDRAYQDAAYSILPALDPDGKNWSWREFGDGWLNFKGVTIAEAFDRVNEFFMKTIPRKGLTINDSQVEIEHLPLQTRKVLKASTNGIGDEKKLTLLSDNPSFTNSFKFKQNLIDDWKNYIYFSEYATLRAFLDNKKLFEIEITDQKDLKEKIGVSQNILTIRDIHANENSGTGFWRGFRVDIDEPLDPTPGDHTLTLEVSGKPDYDPTLTEGSKSISYHIDEEPYSLQEAQLKQVEKPRVDGFAQTFCLSGVVYCKLPFIGNFKSTISKAVKGYVKDENYFEIKSNQEEKGEVAILNTLAKLTKNEQDEDFLDLTLESSLKIDSPYFVKQFSIDTITLWGWKEEIKKVFTDLFVENHFTFVKHEIKEDERVCSGKELYPVVNPLDSNSCGYPFDSQQLLSSDYKNELQKRLYLKDTEVFTQYEWPKEKFIRDHYSYDYGLLAKEGIKFKITDPESYRFATFIKFEGKEVVLDHNSGFTLKFESKNPEKWEEALDINTHSTKGLILQVKVVDRDKSTPWFDANSPYNGYSKLTKDGDFAMYAGLSKTLVKRVTFGKQTFSGKLYLRVGVANTSGLTFTKILIEKII